MDFSWEVPTRIHFGTKIYEKALEKEKECLSGAVLLVTTGKTLRQNGYIDEVAGIIRQNGASDVIEYTGAGANPTVIEAMEAGKLAKECNVRSVVAFGGGSAMDLAKAAAVAAVSDIPVQKYLCQGIPAPKETLPVIAIPTTAGTGSELSKAAILSDEQLKIKGGIRGRYLTPRVAIVDSFFTWTMPRQLTMETGFDALAHAVESYLSVNSNVYSRMLSKKAISIIGHCLPDLVRNLDRPEDREKMSYASMLMGMNLYNVGTCLPHRMQYPIGAATGSSHPAGLAALYPAWIGEEFEVSMKQINNILRWLGFPVASNGTEAGQMIQSFLSNVGLSKDTLPNLGITKEMLPDLAEAVSGNIASDRLAIEEGVLLRVYEKAFYFKD